MLKHRDPARTSGQQSRTFSRTPLKITAPIGPVLRNGILDLQRSDRLVVVHSVDDCFVPPPHSGFVPPSQRNGILSRHVHHPGPLSSHPITGLSAATDSLDATIIPTRLTPPGSDTSPLLNQEYMPPSSARSGNSMPSYKKPSKMPRSRTFNVLQAAKFNTLTFSRFSTRSTSSSGSAAPVSHDDTRPLAAQTAPPATRPLPSQPASPATRSTPTASDSDSFAGRSTSSPLPRADSDLGTPPSYIVRTAQPSAYWAGRFVALHDRFQSEQLQPANLDFLATRAAARATVVAPSRAAPRYERPTHLSASSTTSALHKLTALDPRPAPRPSPRDGTASRQRAAELQLVDDDERCRRVFRHLDALCVSVDARASLYQWRQDFARHSGRLALLPAHGLAADCRGVVARLLNAGRRSPSAAGTRSRVRWSQDRKRGRELGQYHEL